MRHSIAASAVLLAGVVTMAACSSSTPASSAAGAATGISPGGAGQSTLAGLPGATGTGPASPLAGSAMPSMTMSQGTAPANTAPVSGNAVQIKNFAFAPAAITVKAGTTVTWTNQDTDAHTVTSQNNSGPLTSAALNTGQSYSYKFTKPGTYSYLCTIHPFMTATVTVTP